MRDGSGTGGSGDGGVSHRTTAVGWLTRAARDTTASHHIVALIHRLHGHDKVVAVCNHHVSHLVQRFSCHLDAINLQDLIIDGQQARALGQAARYQTGNEDTWDLFQAMGRDTDTGSITDVESQGLVRAMPVEPNSPVRFRKDVHVNNGRHRTEILRHANADVGSFAVQVIAKSDHGLLFPGQSAGAKVAVVNLFCKSKQEWQLLILLHLKLKPHVCTETW